MTPAELAAATNVKREDLEALEAGRPAPDDILAALSASLSTDLGNSLLVPKGCAGLPMP
jgi:hypothetical protein